MLRDLLFDINQPAMMTKFRPIMLLLLANLAGDLTLASAAAAPPGAKAKATIVITRSEDALYLGVPAAVELNGSKIAGLWRGESFTGSIAPGHAVLKVSAWSSPGSSGVSFDALPGRSYRFTVAPRGSTVLVAFVGGFIGMAIEGGGPFGIAPAPGR